MPQPIRASIPLSAWLMAVPGLVCLLAGVGLMLGDFSRLHPLLAETGSGLALLVSGVALLGSAAFPLALRRLALQDEAADGGR